MITVKEVLRRLQIKIGIFVITHISSDRFSRSSELLQSTARIIQNLNGSPQVEQYIISWQPTTLHSMKKSYIQFLLFKFHSNLEWFKISRHKAVIRLFLSEVKALIHKNSQFQLSSRKLHATQVLSKKHVRAWERCIDESMDAVIILEDDAIYDSANQRAITEIYAFLKSDKPTFINLGSGNDKSKYTYDEFSIDDEKIDFQFARFADTTCAYFMNKTGVNLALNEYFARGIPDSIGIDFILSDIFIKRREFVVLHSSNPPFRNGSLIGRFTSQLDSTKNLDS